MGCPASGQSPCSQLLFFLWVKKLHCPPQPHPSKWLRQSRICLQCKRLGFGPSVRKIPWRRKWQPTPLFLPGEFHGQGNLVGYSPGGHKELNTTE